MQSKPFLCNRNVKDLLAQELCQPFPEVQLYIVFMSMLLGSGSKEAFAFQGTFWQIPKTNKLLLSWRPSWRESLAQLDKAEGAIYHCNSNLPFARMMVWNNYQVTAWELMTIFPLSTYLKIAQTDKFTVSDRENSDLS